MLLEPERFVTTSLKMCLIRDVLAFFGSESRGFAAQKRGEMLQNMRIAHVLQHLSPEREHRWREHAGAMRIRHILNQDRTLPH